MQNYCISTICTDADGTLYYKNDSCYLMAVANNVAYISGMEIEEQKIGADLLRPEALNMR